MDIPLSSSKREKPVEEFDPKKYAKSDCRFCHGGGWVEKIVTAGADLTIMDTCVCVKKRMGRKRI